MRRKMKKRGLRNETRIKAPATRVHSRPPVSHVGWQPDPQPSPSGDAQGVPAPPGRDRAPEARVGRGHGHAYTHTQTHTELLDAAAGGGARPLSPVLRP